MPGSAFTVIRTGLRAVTFPGSGAIVTDGGLFFGGVRVAGVLTGMRDPFDMQPNPRLLCDQGLV
jgi:hypothetical protein